tara:strand:- start:399 stop:620 length:222 start_codon:yes stop_codon:yes gene_type:complete
MKLEKDHTAGQQFKTIEGNLWVTGKISDVYSKEEVDAKFTPNAPESNVTVSTASTPSSNNVGKDGDLWYYCEE